MTCQSHCHAMHFNYFINFRRSTAPRVVTVSSAMAEHCQPLDFEDFQTERKKYPGHKLYAQSKLANMLFTVELQRKSDANGWGISGVWTEAKQIYTK